MGSRIATKGRDPRSSLGPELDASGSTPRVLLAEDDAPMRLLLASALRHGGFEVIQARDRSELLGRLAGVPGPAAGATVDVVIVDLRGPALNGLDLLALLRNIDWATPVILVVARGDPAARGEASRFGPTVVIERPFAVEDLLSTVCDWA